MRTQACKLLALAFCLALLLEPVAAQTAYYGQTIEEILSLPEEQIDTGLAVLVLAKGDTP